MTYHVMEEASEAVVCYTSDYQDAVKDAKSRRGKYIVMDYEDNVLFDTQPNVSYKI